VTRKVAKMKEVKVETKAPIYHLERKELLSKNGMQWLTGLTILIMIHVPFAPMS